jgi:hypothetical protein
MISKSPIDRNVPHDCSNCEISVNLFPLLRVQFVSVLLIPRGYFSDDWFYELKFAILTHRMSFGLNYKMRIRRIKELKES